MFRKIVFLIFFTLLITVNAQDQDEDIDDVQYDNTDDQTDKAVEPEKENGVYVLTDDNFDSFVEGKDVVLLEFYAPWCGHCKQFAPTYEKIAQSLEGKVPVGKIDATVNNALAQRFEIQGYPTIKILKNSEPITYDGSRTEDAIINKINELSDPNWKPPPEAVITLTEENFDDTVNEADIILVEFYAPWCGHCKKLAPEYEAAAQELKRRDPPIPLAKVDATAESDLASRFSVSGYPTLKLFRRGRDYEYGGGRDKNTIVNYMIEQSKPPSQVVSSVKAVRNLLHHAIDVTIVGCFSGEDDPALDLFQTSGNSLRSQFNFHHTFDNEVISDIGSSVGNIVLFHPERFHSKYEKKKYQLTLSSETTKDDLKTFFEEHAVPLVGERTRVNMESRYKKRPLVVVYYGVDFSFDYRVTTQMWRSKVLEVANEMKDIVFAIASEDSFSDELKKAGLDDSPEEVNVIIYDQENRRYPMPPNEDFDEDLLREFVEDFQSGKLKPKYKSAPKPKKNKGAVKVVVADTFDEIVMDKSKNVLIEFYAPWCGHCKKLEPEYKKVGKKFKDSGDVIIAKMDATANDVPHTAYKVEGFPTMYWAPAGSKDDPIKHESRSYDDIVEFIEKELSKTKGKEEL